MDTMVFGLLTVSALAAAGVCLYHKRPLPGLLFSLGAVGILWLTGRSWFFMLLSSGKDTALLGFQRYPAAPVILLVLTAGAISGVILSIVKLIHK